MKEQHEQQPADDTPLTVGFLVRWVGIAATAIGIVASAAWYSADTHAQLDAVKTEQTKNEKAHEAFTAHEKQTDQIVADLNRKLDTAVAILERIDKKVGKP